PRGVALARVGQQGVFVLAVPPASAAEGTLTEVTQLSLSNLSRVASTDAAGREPRLELAGEKILLANEDRFELPGLKHIESGDPPTPPGVQRSQLPSRLSYLFADGLVWDNVVWDNE